MENFKPYKITPESIRQQEELIERKKKEKAARLEAIFNTEKNSEAEIRELVDFLAYEEDVSTQERIIKKILDWNAENILKYPDEYASEKEAAISTKSEFKDGSYGDVYDEVYEPIKRPIETIIQEKLASGGCSTEGVFILASRVLDSWHYPHLKETILQGTGDESMISELLRNNDDKPEKVARAERILEAFSRIVTQGHGSITLRKELQENKFESALFGESQMDKEMIQDEKNDNRVFMDFYEDVANNIESFKNPSVREYIEIIFDELENRYQRKQMLVRLLKLSKKYDRPYQYQNLPGVELIKKTADQKYFADWQDLHEQVIDETLEIAEENYRTIFQGNPEKSESILDEMRVELFSEEKMKTQTAYALRYRSEVIAFCKFRPEGPGEVFATTFNVDQSLQGLSLGGQFIESVLKEESEKNTIRAITRMDNTANEMYRRLGFVFGDTFEKNGVEYYNIKLDKRKQPTTETPKNTADTKMKEAA